MYQFHEIMGTDLPIYKEQREDHFTLFQMTHLDFDFADFDCIGYTRVVKGLGSLFAPVYALKKALN